MNILANAFEWIGHYASALQVILSVISMLLSFLFGYGTNALVSYSSRNRLGRLLDDYERNIKGLEGTHDYFAQLGYKTLLERQRNLLIRKDYLRLLNSSWNNEKITWEKVINPKWGFVVALGFFFPSFSLALFIFNTETSNLLAFYITLTMWVLGIYFIYEANWLFWRRRAYRFFLKPYFSLGIGNRMTQNDEDSAISLFHKTYASPQTIKYKKRGLWLTGICSGCQFGLYLFMVGYYTLNKIVFYWIAVGFGILTAAFLGMLFWLAFSQYEGLISAQESESIRKMRDILTKKSGEPNKNVENSN